MVFFRNSNGPDRTNATLLPKHLPPPTHLVGLPEPVIDPEEAQGPARGLVALAAHGEIEKSWRERRKRTTTTTTTAALVEEELVADARGSCLPLACA